MALSPLPLLPPPLLLSSSSSPSYSPFPPALFLRLRTSTVPPLRLLSSPVCCSPETAPASAPKGKTKKKLRPSFYDQTVERWSANVTSQRSRFPWQEEAKEEEREEGSSPVATVSGSSKDGNGGGKGATFIGASRLVSAPWDQGARRRGAHLGFGGGNDVPPEGFDSNGGVDCKEKRIFASGKGNVNVITEIKPGILSKKVNFHSNSAVSSKGKRTSGVSGTGRLVTETRTKVLPEKIRSEWGIVDREVNGVSPGQVNDSSDDGVQLSRYKYENSSVRIDQPYGDFSQGSHPVSHKWTKGEKSKESTSEFETDAHISSTRVGLKNGVEHRGDALKLESQETTVGINIYSSGTNSGKGSAQVISPSEIRDSAMLPWVRNGGHHDRNVVREKSNTELAERMIPEPELKRLRNLSLGMKERMKVGSAGVTEALVENIREKWKEVEVVKMRFEGQPAINMRRTHEILESKTGGLVIWRSGSSLVLYRGMTYQLPCARSYSEHVDTKDTFQKSKDAIICTNGVPKPSDVIASQKKFNPRKVASLREPSDIQLDASDIDVLLNQLGPRYNDWSGRSPLPVDADLLPSVVPGYKSPPRLLPHKVKLGLRNSEMTYLRRLARTLPPHFALGRNRNHQGLAEAMVKLWEKSLIAKVAIKRGVPNTCNERMAEELKQLTGGVLLSRNKEFIIFYRGNDFLPPSVADVISEREKLANVRQDEEDIARERASTMLVPKPGLPKPRLVAGTLAETVEARSHWANEPSDTVREKMMRNETLAQHASVIRYMEKKRAIAYEKVRKAEKALAKVQEVLEPADLPRDLETVTDEERFLFRKIGLKMRAFLSVGRREIFDGTVENMHLNWKHRELVKIFVKGKNFAQVKHIAISLEAESGGVLISLDKTTKGYAIIVYRGKNYQRPSLLRPRNLLTRRQALERSIELQRREALKHHIANLQEEIVAMKAKMDQMETNETANENAQIQLNDAFSLGSDVEEEGEEAYLETYEWDSDNADDESS